MFTLCRQLAPLIVLGAATLSPAFAADPFPDQPGALSPAEIQAATKAMNSRLGGEPAPPLVASGKRSPEHMMPSYALFASPLADFSDRIKTRRQVICNYFRTMSGWQCTGPHTELRMKAHGVEHVFTYVVDVWPEDTQTAVDIADFMYSPCFGDQYKAMGGTPFAPSSAAHSITTLMSDRGGFTVRTGPDAQADVYRIERTDKKTDGCGFAIHHVRVGTTGALLPEKYAKEFAEQSARAAAEESARQRAQAVAEEAYAKQPAQRFDMGEFIGGAIGLAIMIVCWFSYFRTWHFRDRRSYILVHLPLSLVVLLPMYEAMPKGGANIRIDLMIFLPAIGAAFLCYVVKLVRLYKKFRRENDAAQP